MKAKQNLRISLSDLPLGSKSAPPLPPPMFTRNPRGQPFVDSVELKLNEKGKYTYGQSMHS